MITILQADKSQIWNLIELFQIYQDNTGSVLTHYSLIEKLQQHFGDDLIVLTTHGYSSIITFHKNAALMMKMAKDDDESDNIEKSISIFAPQIVKESKSINYDRSSYQVNINTMLLLSTHLTTSSQML